MFNCRFEVKKKGGFLDSLLFYFYSGISLLFDKLDCGNNFVI